MRIKLSDLDPATLVQSAEVNTIIATDWMGCTRRYKGGRPMDNCKDCLLKYLEAGDDVVSGLAVELTAAKQTIERLQNENKCFLAMKEGVAIRISDLEIKIKRLEAIVTVQDDLISWYETEGERSCHEDAYVPEDLRELEEAIKAAKKTGDE